MCVCVCVCVCVSSPSITQCPHNVRVYSFHNERDLNQQALFKKNSTTPDCVPALSIVCRCVHCPGPIVALTKGHPSTDVPTLEINAEYVCEFLTLFSNSVRLSSVWGANETPASKLCPVTKTCTHTHKQSHANVYVHSPYK